MKCRVLFASILFNKSKRIKCESSNSGLIEHDMSSNVTESHNSHEQPESHSLSYEEELTVCFVKEPNSSEESALSFHLSIRLTNTNAAFTIINGLTISFVSDANDNIISMDSHLHLPKGALLAQSQRSDIEELLNWLKLKLSATLCRKKFM